MASPDWKFDMAGPVPPVKPSDVKNAFALIASVSPHRTSEGSVGICSRLFTERCEPGADIVAVCLRALLVEAALESGLLDEWRDGDNLHDRVFEVAATVPLAAKPDIGFDIEDLIRALK